MEPGRKIRPATSRVKTAIFDILPYDLSGAMVLDLFAGTGSLGIEAISRGASAVVFIDQSFRAGELIKDNLAKLGCLGRGEIIIKKANTALNQLALEGAKFNLVLIDPPFDQELSGRTLAHLAQSPLLAKGAIVVVRSSPREPLAEQYGRLVLKDKRKYGESIVRFYLWYPEVKEKEEEK